MNIEIKNIEVKENVRHDFQDLAELATSMKEVGLITPILVEEVKANSYRLIAGARRLRVAKELLGWDKIPANLTIKPSPDIDLQLVENIQRQNLNAVEEGKAFKAMMKKRKLTTKDVAARISKPHLYVKRRLEILNASGNVQAAIIEGKIKLGHALALSQVGEKKKQDKILKDVIREKLTVDSTCRSIRQESRRLENAQFDTANCKGCRFNGGEQALLDESEGSLKNLCLDPNCFDSKTRQWVQGLKRDLKEKGVKIVDGEAANLLYRKKSYAYDQGAIAAAEKDMVKNPKDYAVQLEADRSGDFKKTIFKLKAEKTTEKKGPTNPKVAEAQLKNKIEAYQRQFLIRRNKEKQVPDSRISKALTAYFLIEDAGWSNSKDMLQGIGDSYGLDSEKVLKKVLNLEEGALDELINKQIQIRIKDLSSFDDTLLILSKATKVDMKKEFVVNESYLQLHTIAQLPVIAKELGVKVSKGKKTDMIKEILKHDLRGKVPKAMVLK